MLERLVDNCAREIGLPREEIRACNFVKASQMPFTTKTDQTYDVGDFEGAMREALSEADYAGFDAREGLCRARQGEGHRVFELH